MLSRTKEDIMEEIHRVVGEDATPSQIRQYLKEKMGFSRLKIYRFLSSATPESRTFYLGERKQVYKSEVSISVEEWEKLNQAVFEELHSKGKDSTSTITYDEITELMKNKEIETLCQGDIRFICHHILGIDAKSFLKLQQGEIGYTGLTLGLGFQDEELSKKIKYIKNIFLERYAEKGFSDEEIFDVAKQMEIPVKIILETVFGYSRAQVLQFQKDVQSHKPVNVHLQSKYPFIDYPYNSPLDHPLSSDIKFYETLRMGKESTTIDVMTEEDKKDSIVGDLDFYVIHASSREEYIRILNEKNKQLRERMTYLVEKYDDKYEKLKEIVDELNIYPDGDGKYTTEQRKILEPYLEQLKEIIKRNPKYYTYYPFKLQFEDFAQIANDFHVSEDYLGYKLFNNLPNDMERRRKMLAEGKQSYFEMSDPAEILPGSVEFFEHFGDDLQKSYRRITYRSIREQNGNSDAKEDIEHELIAESLKRIVPILFFGESCEREEEYLQKIYRYMKVVSVGLAKRSRQRDTSLDEEISENDSRSRHETTAAETEVNVDELVSSFDDPDGLIQGMLRYLGEYGQREIALEKLAEEMGATPGIIQEKLDKIYESRGE